MSNREIAKDIIDRIPESKLYYVISFLQGAALPDEVPNEETLASFAEIEKGGGISFSGSTEDFLNMMMED